MKNGMIVVVLILTACAVLAAPSVTNEVAALITEIVTRAEKGDTAYFACNMDPNDKGKETNLVAMIQRSGMATNYAGRCTVNANCTGNLNYHYLERGCNLQIDLVKTAHEIIAEAIPCNVLYHRINAEAHRDSWTGWVPYMGNLLNMFSLSELVGGSEAPVYEDASAGVNVGLSAQRTAAPYQSIDGHAMVIDDLGNPVEGAAVSTACQAGQDEPDGL